MEVQEEATAQVSVSKGKRTKRQRFMSPFLLTMAPTSPYSSSAEGSDSGGGSGSGGGVVDRLITPASDPSSDSGEFITQSNTTTSAVDEEADMANCLILLAQGRRSQKSPHHVLAAASKVTAAGGGGSEVYQCKTCNRCFLSFQALGGHRASHKKPKATVTSEEKRHVSVQEKSVQFDEGDDNTTLSLQIRSGDINVSTTTTYSTPIVTNKSRVHECSICGAEFSSGQALGGHMRRHRSSAMATTSTGRSSHDEEVKKKPRTVLSLDLNLPAPEDDHLHHHRESKFPFAPKEQVIVFSASPLVDCHY